MGGRREGGEWEDEKFGLPAFLDTDLPITFYFILFYFF